MKVSLGSCQVGSQQMRFSNWTTERHTEGQKNIIVTFIDLEIAYDQPRKAILRCSRERNVPEKYTRLVQDMYQGCKQ